MIDMANLTVLGLSFLWGDCLVSKFTPCHSMPSSAQTNVHKNIVNGHVRFMHRVEGVVATQRNAASKTYPEFVASRVEMCDVACTCDAVSFMSPALRDVVMDDKSIFGDSRVSKRPVPRYGGTSRHEYAALTVRGLESGKLRLRKSVA